MTVLAGWGRTAASVTVFRAAGQDEHLAQAVAGAPARRVVPRGLGRSYGDPAQNGGVVLDATSRSRILSVDVRGGA